MKYLYCFVMYTIFSNSMNAQTEIDGLMMQKNYFCVGTTYGKSSFSQYWEGDLKRENANLGTVTSSNISINGNFGISKKLNFLFSVPYIWTNASAGVMDGQKGFQDISLWLKYVFFSKEIYGGDFNTIALGGYSNPISNYNPDFLPLSIGLNSKVSTARLMFDYHRKNLSITASGAFMYRSNVFLDRNTYYTTEMHYSNEVYMPNMTNFNVRVGYRTSVWIFEGIFDQMNTLGGFDIPRNGMPFVSNQMNASRIGLNLKYEAPFLDGLSFVFNANQTILGRNVGQTTSFNTGVFYIIDFSKKQK